MDPREQLRVGDWIRCKHKSLVRLYGEYARVREVLVRDERGYYKGLLVAFEVEPVLRGHKPYVTRLAYGAWEPSDGPSVVVLLGQQA